MDQTAADSLANAFFPRVMGSLSWLLRDDHLGSVTSSCVIREHELEAECYWHASQPTKQQAKDSGVIGSAHASSQAMLPKRKMGRLVPHKGQVHSHATASLGYTRTVTQTFRGPDSPCHQISAPAPLRSIDRPASFPKWPNLSGD